MPTLHAFLVGIKNYANPRHDLRGPATDVAQMDLFLQTYCKERGVGYNPLILLNDAATRKALIDGFSHFSRAEKADCCLFFFSGHGSRYEAPEVFWGIEPDHSLESIVCFDSRVEGGHDLMDKELSFLIWQASQRTELPFVSITDSCHSGSLRDLPNGQQPRWVEEVPCTLAPEAFTGYEHYQRTPDGQLSPPLGRRVHLAAARDVEYANEVDEGGGRIRGIFSYCLLEALGLFGVGIRYSELIQRANQRIRNNRFKQSAQLEATFAEDRQLGFLFEKPRAAQRNFLVTWDREKQSWVVNAGALHGMPASESGVHNTLKIKEDERVVSLTQVMPGYSLVSGMEGLDPKRGYIAGLEHRVRPKLALAFTPESDPGATQVVRQYLDANAAGQYAFGEAALYQIDAGAQSLSLKRRLDTRPLFPPETGYAQEQLDAFLGKLEQTAGWQNLLELDNPEPAGRALPVEARLFRVMQANDFSAAAPKEVVDVREEGPAAFRYFEGKHAPLFQFEVRNTGDKELWVSLLYLDAQMSITNQLMPKECLKPGATMPATAIFEGHIHQTIPLFIPSAMLEEGITSAEEYLKLLVSTREWNTDDYDQGGATEFSREGSSSSVPGLVADEELWKAITIPIKIDFQ